MNEKPLHVRVAEVLGFSECYENENGWFGFVDRPGAQQPPWHLWFAIPRYDTDWSATGPLIERHQLTVEPRGDGKSWDAWANETAHGGDLGQGATPLVAVCNLILALHAAGKLPK